MAYRFLYQLSGSPDWFAIRRIWDGGSAILVKNASSKSFANPTTDPGVILAALFTISPKNIH